MSHLIILNSFIKTRIESNFPSLSFIQQHWRYFRLRFLYFGQFKMSPIIVRISSILTILNKYIIQLQKYLFLLGLSFNMSCSKSSKKYSISQYLCSLSVVSIWIAIIITAFFILFSFYLTFCRRIRSCVSWLPFLPSMGFFETSPFLFHNPS